VQQAQVFAVHMCSVLFNHEIFEQWMHLRSKYIGNTPQWMLIILTCDC